MTDEEIHAMADGIARDIIMVLIDKADSFALGFYALGLAVGHSMNEVPPEERDEMWRGFCGTVQKVSHKHDDDPWREATKQ